MRRPRWLDAREVHRWLTLRCGHCGHRFRWKRDGRHRLNPGGPVYHGPCIAYLDWRRKADERLDVLGTVMDLATFTARDVQTVVELRYEKPTERSQASNLAWRVFYDLECANSQPPASTGP
ncbi:hypothetical protein [Cellulosimicrobium sp. CpK407]|uniref:hypothetical protein n=1 Tax=Cellulosimicrobium sp. CpK407 TaxID=3229847 RepID=UPI003F31C37E